MSEAPRIPSPKEHADPQAAEQLLPLVYDELRKLAAQKLAHEKPGQTLQATALVHEAYLRLVGDGNVPPQFQNRSHFFAAAAMAMRRILIDAARRKLSQKHGGDRRRQEINEIAGPEPDEELLALDEALAKLAANEPVKASVVELRYFGGLTNDQAAEVLGISPATADRYWAYARAWLFQQINSK
jgi:RNA polymerase sigma factor (TIGR02999 family)